MRTSSHTFERYPDVNICKLIIPKKRWKASSQPRVHTYCNAPNVSNVQPRCSRQRLEACAKARLNMLESSLNEGKGIFVLTQVKVALFGVV